MANKQDKKAKSVNVNANTVNANTVNVNTDVLRQYVTIGNNNNKILNKSGYIPFLVENAEAFGIGERASIVKQWADNTIVVPVALKDVCRKINADLGLGRDAETGLNSIIQAIGDVCKPLGLQFADQRGNSGIANAIAAAAAQAAVEQKIADVKATAKDAVTSGIRTAITAMVDAGMDDDLVRKAFPNNIDIVEDIFAGRDARRDYEMLKCLKENGISTLCELKALFDNNAEA
jgi:hypothetical protein